ncbi:BON domain-containing protein [Tahibacter sp. UC22_41]|uniref:BON domain-containing protein n=1 Tax=Tahibacter sp. UC22_41 TaxID=3350178 RepID=UPI002C0292C0|nr:BON domain-containing protein [Tahibacter sp.]HWU52178.1 BON domain-containing protein [Tahibacter sp.]
MRFPTIQKTAAVLLLSATAAFAWAAQPATANENKPNSHESDQPVGDTWITTKVKTELLADSAVKGSDINVSTVNGVVTLAGVLDNQAAIDKAITIAKGVKGVTDVDTRALKLRK